ncbi:DUF4817 domain-containing protein [Trichonephila clavipes]|nr:DUF4817 domain-containing protein [Trichonephila clavipes]
MSCGTSGFHGTQFEDSSRESSLWMELVILSQEEFCSLHQVQASPDHILDCLELSWEDLFFLSPPGIRFLKGQRSFRSCLTPSDRRRISHNNNKTPPCLKARNPNLNIQLKSDLGPPESCPLVMRGYNLVALHSKYDQARRRFVEWAQNEIAVVPDFHKRILFSDEAHFWLNGYVNKQNCRIWSEANPQVYVETPLLPEKLTGALYGLVESFFKYDEGHNVTVNGDRYRAMITNFFIPELNNHDVQELWFQQDGATCHTARATIDLLKDTFGDRLISRFGPVNWPPRSCDLTPLDYFLWSYVN